MTSPAEDMTPPRYWMRVRTDGMAWSIRGLLPDGSFGGHYEDPVGGTHGNFKGRILPSEHERVVRLIEEIRRTRTELPAAGGDYRGMLGSGVIGSGEIVYRWFESSTPPPADSAMEEIFEIMYPYLAVHCRRSSRRIGSARQVTLHEAWAWAVEWVTRLFIGRRHAAKLRWEIEIALAKRRAGAGSAKERDRQKE